MMKGLFYGGTLFATFLLTVLISRFLIPYLKSKKMGQKILEIGPRWHKNKEGTPTMGGLSFVFASFLVLLVVVPLGYALDFLSDIKGLLLVYGYALLNCLIGVIDDRTKFKKGKNEGLTPPQKYFLQLFVACLFLFVGIYLYVIPGGANDALYIPFFGYRYWLSNTGFRIFYYALCLVLLTGMVNAVNLTDGIDGLAASVTAVVCVFFGAAAFMTGSIEVAEFAFIVFGGCFGFWLFNKYPAKVFMGDTGSLFLGGSVCAMALLLKMPIILVIVGGVYVIETVSVIIQVTSFKLTGKRVFKMTPIHHHFEMSGFSENKIVCMAVVTTLLLCAVALGGIYLG